MDMKTTKNIETWESKYKFKHIISKKIFLKRAFICKYEIIIPLTESKKTKKFIIEKTQKSPNIWWIGWD